MVFITDFSVYFFSIWFWRIMNKCSLSRRLSFSLYCYQVVQQHKGIIGKQCLSEVDGINEEANYLFTDITNLTSSKEIEDLRIISYNDKEITYLDFGQEIRNIGEFVELECDMYCYIFRMILEDDTCQHKILKFFNVTSLIFTIQIGLISLYWNSCWDKPIANSDWSEYMARFLCAFVLHLMIIPEVKVALQMLRY